MRFAAIQPPTSDVDVTYLVAIGRGDGPASAVTVQTGLQLAREAGARVVLYDRSAEASFIDLYEAAAWSAGNVPSWDQLLMPEQLRRLGYGYLADQLSQARALGLDAAAWLPFGVGPAAMARCCTAWGVTQVVLPAKVPRRSWRARLRGHILAAFQASMPGIQIVLVDADGRPHRITGSAGERQPTTTGALA